ncbi:MAG: HPr family phosphocarrier protein [Defluviitaleaceae bacterium]|nr:HPr family phosphocarrier protein [Defluviitaleaceae bacterium]
MIEKKLQAKRDLQARTAALFVQLAGKFEANTKIAVGNKQTSCKSLLGMISLSVLEGYNVVLTAEGTDAEEAIKELSAFMEEKANDAE